MSAIYLFPGQGSQFKGMGEGLFERYQSLVDKADNLLGYSIKDLCLRDPDHLLDKTEYTQPAIYTVNALSYLSKIEEEKLKPHYVAGHSLGEYSALFAAGAFDYITGLKLVQKRGLLMAPTANGAMAAIVNIDQPQVREVLEILPFKNIEVANINSKFQCIISGLYDEVCSDETKRRFENAGAKIIALNVRTAFHSLYMKDAQYKFEKFLVDFDLKPLKLPVVANYTARPYPTNNYEKVLGLQISHPVKWYESISWLLKQGYSKYIEVGPGNVLTKLTNKILEDPMDIMDEKTYDTKNDLLTNSTGKKSQKTKENSDRKIIFMYGGQGYQYYQMGRELFDTNSVFKQSMIVCDNIISGYQKTSIIDVIYNPSQPGFDFDNINQSHPALFSIGYSLTQALLEEGIEPYGVLGHSLGEYIAATVAKTISLEDGLYLVLKQAQLLQSECVEGGLLSVLSSTELLEKRSDLFANVSLAGINFTNNFLVSGLDKDLNNTASTLVAEGISTLRLPVRYGFHSQSIDSIKEKFRNHTSNIKIYNQVMPIYSSILAKKWGADILESFDSHLWNIVRKQTNFQKLIESSFTSENNYFFVDLSPTATLTSFLNHGFKNRYSSSFVINQYGRNNQSFKKLITTLLN